MAETKKKSVVFVVALIVLAAMIVVVATALSGCSGNDNSADPTPTETAVPEQTTAPAASNGSAGSIGSAASTGSSAKQPSASSGSSSTSGSKDNGGSDRNKLEYILNYGDNVEKGMEKSTDDFVNSLENIGSAYDKGDVEGISNTAKDFTKGLGDYLGGIRNTIVP